jgi:hypothetical protein
VASTHHQTPQPRIAARMTAAKIATRLRMS